MSDHCKNSSVTCTPNLLHRHTKTEIGVSIEQIWCAGHTSVFTVYQCFQVPAKFASVCKNIFKAQIFRNVPESIIILFYPDDCAYVCNITPWFRPVASIGAGGGGGNCPPPPPPRVLHYQLTLAVCKLTSTFGADCMHCMQSAPKVGVVKRWAWPSNFFCRCPPWLKFLATALWLTPHSLN